jgi:hypothetical protein
MIDPKAERSQADYYRAIPSPTEEHVSSPVFTLVGTKEDSAPNPDYKQNDRQDSRRQRIIHPILLE